MYTAYDDAEFADGATPGTRPSILAQYDQDKKSAPKFSLGTLYELCKEMSSVMCVETPNKSYRVTLLVHSVGLAHDTL